jgi:hypothetical protein
VACVKVPLASATGNLSVLAQMIGVIAILDRRIGTGLVAIFVAGPRASPTIDFLLF